MVLGRSGSGVPLQTGFEELRMLKTPLSGVNYLAMVRMADGETVALGVIYAPISGEARTLALY